MDKAGLSDSERQMIENMDLLRSSFDKGEGQLQDWEKKKKKTKNGEEVPYAVSRYVPILKRIIEVCAVWSFAFSYFHLIGSPLRAI
ncbi:MAG: hypothetical protein ACYCOU_19435 [Sulfobacillus sp.]